MTTTSRLRAVLLGSGAVLALASGPALASEVEDLDAQIDKLQSHLDQLKQQRAEVGVKPAVAPADAVVGGDFPGSFKLPGSDTSMAIHGYVKADFFVDINQQLGDSATWTNITPNGSVAQNRGGPQFRFHARQSRMTFETRTPTNYGQLRTFVQGDFFGGGGNQFVTNSSPFRIRHAYGELGPVLTGQTWSNFGNIDDTPETLDFDGPPIVFVRQPQIRYTRAIGKFTVSGAIENPQGDLTANNGATSSAPIPKSVFGDSVHTIDRAPDLTVRGVYTDTWGDISVSGIGRRFETDNGGGDATGLTPQSASAWGGGGAVSGTINIGKLLAFAPIASDQVGFQGFYGSGIGRYLAIGGGLFDSAVIKNFGTTAVRLETQPQWGGAAWYLHNWTDTLRSNFVGGIQRNHWSDAIPQSTALTDRVITAHANLIWSPVKSVNLGVEYIFGERDIREDPVTHLQQSGTASRVQVSAQYLF